MMTTLAPHSRLSRPPMYLNLDEAAEAVRLSRRQLQRWIAAGRLAVRKVGRRTLVRPEDLAALIEGRAAAAS